MADSSPDDVYGINEDPRADPSERTRRKRRKAERPAVPPKKAKGMSKNEIIALVVILTILISFAAFMAIRQMSQRNAEQAVFAAAAGEYLFTPVEAAPNAARPKAGKVVLVDMDKQAFDPFHWAIREDLRAQSPEEVQTVAQMRYTRLEVGRFEMGARAIQLSCTMTLADRASRTILGTRSFVWGKPPTSIRRSGSTDDVTGTPPLQEIAAFLSELR